MATVIAVFAPTVVLTVTIEDGPEIHFHAGGQGFWVARMIASLGDAVALCTVFGGESGDALRALAGREDVEMRWVPIHQANGAYVHDRRGGERVVVAESPAPKLSRHEVDELYTLTLTTALDAGMCVLTGVDDDDVIPDDVFRRLASDLRANGTTVVADLSGPQLKAALESGLSLVKISHAELIDGGFAAQDEPSELKKGIERLLEAGAESVVVSRAESPALAYVEGRFIEIVPPELNVQDYRGAGDSMTAALAVGWARGLEVNEVLKLAAAAGALNVTRRGLGTGSRDEIESLSGHVELRPASPST